MSFNKLSSIHTTHNTPLCTQRDNKYFCHYLITRFNVVHIGLSNYALQQKGTIVQTDEWLQKRFELFEKYCYPSVCGQTNKNFKWLVLFNSETPSQFKDKIVDYQLECPQFVPLYIKPEMDEVAYVIDYIKKDSTSEKIITTRLDNDDCIRNSYLELVQKSFKETYSNTFLFYRFGYQHIVKSKLLTKFADDFNHFESRVENLHTLKTVFVKDDRHDLIDQYGEVIAIPPIQNSRNTKLYEGMWIEVVHDSNVVNNADLSGRPMLIKTSEFSYGLKLSKLKWFIYKVKYSIKKRKNNIFKS